MNVNDLASDLFTDFTPEEAEKINGGFLARRNLWSPVPTVVPSLDQLPRAIPKPVVPTPAPTPPAPRPSKPGHQG